MIKEFRGEDYIGILKEVILDRASITSLFYYATFITVDMPHRTNKTMDKEIKHY